ncbi:Gfo/Idh/MocA family protein [Pseudomonas sp. BNK-15]|uniref:Gfo/Idh/MocA family protein n=1 Tax=Pseudomonas sp. BNK-15 TaxID=3376152 RepID=UPI0039BF3311
MKIGIIGLGNVAELHVTAINEIDPTAYVGGWGRTPGKVTAFKERFGGVLYPTPEALLDDPSIDAVVICTNADTHFHFAREALFARKHVLIEKPICTSADKIRELEILSRGVNRLCAPSHNYVYAETMQRVRAHIDAGHLGEIVNFWAIYNKRHRAEIGAPDLTMSELMVHHIYCMLYFLGRPERVFATGSNVHFENPQAHDQLMIIAEYPNGNIANLWGSFSADDCSRDPWSVYFKIIGKNGSSVVPWDTTKFGDARLPFWDDGTYWDSFYQIQKFFIEECLTGKRAPLSSLSDAYDAAVIMDAARKSISERRSIDLDFS